MTNAEALEYLREHQPMPSDAVVTAAQADRFIEVLQLLEAYPSEQAIPLLVGSVSETTGLGMYEHIGFVLRKLPVEQVAQHLIPLLEHPMPEVRGRAAWWCSDCPCPLLAMPLMRQLRQEQNEEVRYALKGALQACGTSGL